MRGVGVHSVGILGGGNDVVVGVGGIGVVVGGARMLVPVFLPRRILLWFNNWSGGGCRGDSCIVVGCGGGRVLGLLNLCRYISRARVMRYSRRWLGDICVVRFGDRIDICCCGWDGVGGAVAICVVMVGGSGDGEGCCCGEDCCYCCLGGVLVVLVVIGVVGVVVLAVGGMSWFSVSLLMLLKCGSGN